MNGQDKTLNKRTKQSGVNNLPDEEFKVMITKSSNKFWRRMNKHSENLNKFGKGLELSRAAEYNHNKKHTRKESTD